MIRNLTITHGDFIAASRVLGIFSPNLDLILIPLFTTILSYQLTALLIDCMLGFKRPKQCSLSLLHTKLLTNQSSPLHIAAAVLRRDFFDRLRFRNHVPHTFPIHRSSASIPAPVLYRLFALLILPILINVASIIPLLSYSRDYTMKSSLFGGVALGFFPNASIVPLVTISDLCIQRKFQSIYPDAQQLAHFAICAQTFDITPTTTQPPETISLSLTHSISGSVIISIDTNVSQGEIINFGHTHPMSGIHEVAGQIEADGKAFTVRPEPEPSNWESLMRMARDLLSTNCPQSFQPFNVTKTGDGLLRIQTSFPCSRMDHLHFMEAIFYTVLRITFVDAESLVVAEKPISDRLESNRVAVFESGNDIPLVRLRTTRVNSEVLLLSVAAVLLARFLSAIFTKNDVEEGIESCLKTGLGLKREESLFHSNVTVMYGQTYSVGDSVHYGMRRGELEEAAR